MKIKSCVVAMCLTSFLAVSGCATSNQNSVDDSGVNPNLKKDEATFFSQSGAKACAGGALLGILACLGSKSDNKLACAIAAGSAGCALGMTANYLLDNIRANYHNMEDQLDALKAKTEETLKTTENMKSSVRETLEDDERDIARIKKEIEEGKADKSALKAKADEMDKNIAYIRGNIQIANQRLTAINDASLGQLDNPKDPTLAAQKARELDDKIAAVKANIEELNNELEDYTIKTAEVRRISGGPAS